ncbi:MAG: disulfide bond formation protein B [Pseudomonadota bacterium]
MTASDSTIERIVARDRTGLVLLAAVVIPAAALAGAWGIELIGGIAPCPLCLTQRIPYYVGLPIALVGLWLYGAGRAQSRGGKQGLAALAFLAFAVAMAVAAGYGIYHAGVEYGWWPGPTACAGGGPTPETVEELLDQLGKTVPVNCADVPMRVLGLSLAAWNAVVTGTAMVLSVVGVFQIRSAIKR